MIVKDFPCSINAAKPDSNQSSAQSTLAPRPHLLAWFHCISFLEAIQAASAAAKEKETGANRKSSPWNMWNTNP